MKLDSLHAVISVKYLLPTVIPRQISSRQIVRRCSMHVHKRQCALLTQGLAINGAFLCSPGSEGTRSWKEGGNNVGLL